MKHYIKCCLLLIISVPTLAIPTLATAHGPSRVLLVEEIDINAMPAKVWSVIDDFCSIKDWHPAVTECTNDNGNQPDSLRVIKLDSGEQIGEILAKYNPEKLMLQHYMKDNQALNSYPVATHALTITITDNGNNGSTLKWKGAFYRSFPGPNPPPELSDQAAAEKLTAFYKAGMESIKKLAESE